MEIIGLSGYARSGKDEAASILVNEFGFIRVSFADKLREVLEALDPQVGLELDTGGESDRLVPIKLSQVFRYKKFNGERITWDNYKESQYGTEIRRLLQRLGTEAGRQTLWDSIWIDAAFADVPDDAKVVVTDCRFPNEAQAIVDRGGKVARINREGVGPAISSDGSIHSSETSLDDWNFDYTIPNNKGLAEYHANLRIFVDVWGEDRYFEHVIGI